jgi:hypothetical protein
MAAALGFAANAGAQQTGTATPGTTPGQQTTPGTTGTSGMSEPQRTPGETSRSSERNMTVTGCVERGPNGGYILTNAKMENPSGSMSGSSSATGTSGTSTSGTSATGSTSQYGSTGASGAMANVTTWQLEGGSNLSEHVGHKVEITGHPAMSGSSSSSARSGMSGTTAGTSSSGTTSGTSTTESGRSGSMSGQSSTGTSGSATGAEHKLNVESVKMVSTTCS